MDKASIIKLRKELHHLCAADRDQKDKDGNTTINIPIVLCMNNEYLLDEMDCCVIWDDDNEVVYGLFPNTGEPGPLNTICPMVVRAYDYEMIQWMQARVDKNCTMRFLKSKLDAGLTSQAVLDRYNKQLTEINEPESYMMGQPSPTTEKRGLKAEDKVMNETAYKIL